MSARRSWPAGLVVWSALAGLAATPDPRGWTPGGAIAVNTALVVAGPSDHPLLELPKSVSVTGPTVLFYFSPTCPHCRHVAAEVQALASRLGASGKATLIGVASGSAREADLLEFRATYGITFPVIVDAAGDIQGAMGVQSTPSMMLVRPVHDDKGKSRGKVEVGDLWYPFVPGWAPLVEARVSGDVYSMFAPGRFLGTNTCAVCHLQEHQSYR
ncbi:MAG: TlpA disulfide reductase family protein, partial [Myxococcota bacterium]